MLYWGHPVDAAGKYTSLITLATVNETQLQARLLDLAENAS